MAKYQQVMKQYDSKRKQRETEFRKDNEQLLTRNRILKVNVVIALVIVILMTINGLILKRTNGKLREAKAEIEEQNTQLQQIHDTIEEQTSKIKRQCQTLEHQALISAIYKNRMYNTIRLAKPIQDALMANTGEMRECLKDFFVYWKPVAPVSGDFYWLRKAGDYTYLVVADATGHGVPGAFLSMLGISMMNDISKEIDMTSPDSKPGEFLDLLKKRFTSLLGNGNNQMNDSIDLAMLKIDQAKHRITYSGANRPLLLVSDGEAMDFKPTRMCIGYNVLDRGQFASCDIDYEPGDMVYLFSDGLSDQFGGLDSRPNSAASDSTSCSPAYMTCPYKYSKPP